MRLLGPKKRTKAAVTESGGIAVGSTAKADKGMSAKLSFDQRNCHGSYNDNDDDFDDEDIHFNAGVFDPFSSSDNPNSEVERDGNALNTITSDAFPAFFNGNENDFGFDEVVFPEGKPTSSNANFATVLTSTTSSPNKSFNTTSTALSSSLDLESPKTFPSPSSSRTQPSIARKSAGAYKDGRNVSDEGKTNKSLSKKISKKIFPKSFRTKKGRKRGDEGLPSERQLWAGESSDERKLNYCENGDKIDDLVTKGLKNENATSEKYARDGAGLSPDTKKLTLSELTTPVFTPPRNWKQNHPELLSPPPPPTHSPKTPSFVPPHLQPFGNKQTPGPSASLVLSSSDTSDGNENVPIDVDTLEKWTPLREVLYAEESGEETDITDDEAFLFSQNDADDYSEEEGADDKGEQKTKVFPRLLPHAGKDTQDADETNDHHDYSEDYDDEQVFLERSDLPIDKNISSLPASTGIQHHINTNSINNMPFIVDMEEKQSDVILPLLDAAGKVADPHIISTSTSAVANNSNRSVGCTDTGNLSGDVGVSNNESSLTKQDNVNNSENGTKLTLSILAQISGLVDYEGENVQEYGQTYNDDDADDDGAEDEGIDDNVIVGNDEEGQNKLHQPPKERVDEEDSTMVENNSKVDKSADDEIPEDSDRTNNKSRDEDEDEDEDEKHKSRTDMVITFSSDNNAVCNVSGSVGSDQQSEDDCCNEVKGDEGDNRKGSTKAHDIFAMKDDDINKETASTDFNSGKENGWKFESFPALQSFDDGLDEKKIEDFFASTTITEEMIKSSNIVASENSLSLWGEMDDDDLWRDAGQRVSKHNGLKNNNGVQDNYEFKTIGGNDIQFSKDVFDDDSFFKHEKQRLNDNHPSTVSSKAMSKPLPLSKARRSVSYNGGGTAETLRKNKISFLNTERLNASETNSIQETKSQSPTQAVPFFWRSHPRTSSLKSIEKKARSLSESGADDLGNFASKRLLFETAKSSSLSRKGLSLAKHQLQPEVNNTDDVEVSETGTDKVQHENLQPRKESVDPSVMRSTLIKSCELKASPRLRRSQQKLLVSNITATTGNAPRLRKPSSIADKIAAFEEDSRDQDEISQASFTSGGGRSVADRIAAFETRSVSTYASSTPSFRR